MVDPSLPSLGQEKPHDSPIQQVVDSSIYNGGIEGGNRGYGTQ